MWNVAGGVAKGPQNVRVFWGRNDGGILQLMFINANLQQPTGTSLLDFLEQLKLAHMEVAIYHSNAIGVLSSLQLHK
jgi:hypothetical protein